MKNLTVYLFSLYKYKILFNFFIKINFNFNFIINLKKTLNGRDKKIKISETP